MILIVGCGFLGSHLLKHILTKTDEPVLATVRNIKKAPAICGAEYLQCDVTNKSDLSSLAEKCNNEPLTVFYFAACHNIDYVYDNPKEAWKINVKALENFISCVPNIKKFFFASTDCVYGEGNERDFKFSEDAQLKPVNEYGVQKIAAEEIVRSNGFTVLRFPFMLGASLTSTPHFYDKICSKLLNNETVEMIDGMERSVLSYSQVAELIYELSTFTDELPQTINVCSDNAMSKFEIGCTLAKKLNTSSDLIHKITEEEGSKFFKDKRASCTAMDNSLLKSLLKLTEIKWEEEKC